jgi:outer membrane protein
MKRIGLLFLLILNAYCAFSQQQWTLEQCLERAKTENLQIKQRLLQAENANISVQQSKQNLLPDLNMYVGQNFSFGRSIDETNTYQNNNVQNTTFSLSSSLNLYDGGRMFYAIEKSKLDFQALLHDAEQQKSDVSLQVLSNYFQAVYAKQQVKIALEQKELTKLQLEKTEQLIASGRLPKGEIYQVKAQLSQDIVTLVTAQNDVQLALVQLAQLLFIDDVTSFDVVDNLLDNPLEYSSLLLEEVVAQSNAVIPSIKAEELRIKSAEQFIKIEKASFYPRLSLGASYGNGYYVAANRVNLPFGEQWQQNQNIAVGLNLQIPIFNKMSVINRVKQAELTLESQRISLMNVKSSLQQEIQQAYIQTTAAKQKIQAAEANVEAMQLAFDYQTEKFEAGVSTLYEYSEAKNSLIRSITIKNQAVYEYLFRSKALEVYMSKTL